MVCVGYEMVVFVRIEVCIVVRSIGLLASRTGLRVAVGTEETSARTGGHYERGTLVVLCLVAGQRKIKGSD